jgi:hypothetical protein
LAAAAERSARLPPWTPFDDGDRFRDDNDNFNDDGSKVRNE